MNPAAALFAPIFVPNVTVNGFSGAIGGYAVVPTDTLARADHFQDFGVFGATLAPKGMAALGVFRDAQFDENAALALLPADDLAFGGDDARLGNR